MVGYCSTVVLVLFPVLANIGGVTGFAGASTAGVVTRELSRGIIEAIRPLSNGERARARVWAGKRDNVDLTGENCASICGGVAGSGPNQADCNQIIDALNANGTATFVVEAYSVATWAQASCTIEFVQSTADTVTYSYFDFGAITGYLSDTCNAANGYAYGSCIFDGREDAIWVGNTAVSTQSTERTDGEGAI